MVDLVNEALVWVLIAICIGKLAWIW